MFVCVVGGYLYLYNYNYYECCLLGGEDKGNNKPIEPQHLSKDQDKDHANEQARLLGRASNSCVSYDPDGEAGSKATQTHTQPSTQVKKTPANKDSKRI